MPASLLMLGASLLFAVMGVCVKFASADYSAGEIVFYRSLLGLLLMMGVLRWRGIGWRTQVPGLHLGRCVGGTTALCLWFYSIGGLPLATAMTLNYMSSVWIALFLLGGAVLLGPLRSIPDHRLVLAACQAVAGDRDAALRAAVAVELIHAYSLVHDDMPCMDNDVLRRGKPTVHVRFGQAQAMLAGDAMQALAFEVLTPQHGLVPALQARLVGLLARAAGHAGMAGGQAVDLASIGQRLSEAELRDMHRRKTGALLQCSVLMGAACGPAAPAAKAALEDFGAALGLAFQVVDDILDCTQASETLGKTAGKDLDHNKPTYVSVLGPVSYTHLDVYKRQGKDPA